MKISLVIACFNEAEHLTGSVEKLIETLDSSKIDFELIFIDDKSKDSTKDILKKLEKKYKARKFKFLYHTQNQGRGATVTEGIQIARNPIVGFIDIDLEVSPEYIPLFVDAISKGEADVAIAKRNYPFKFWPINYLVREILSRGYVVFTRKFLGHPFHDTEAGYKFFNRQEILPVLEKVTDKHWFWDTEIVIRSYLHGLRIKEIPVVFLRREDKTSTVKLIPDTLAFLKASQSFYKVLNSQIRPSKGLLYKSPFFYKKVMQVYYGDNFEARYKSIANLIDKKSTVVDVCCGDAVLEKYLTKKGVNYLGLDASRYFVLSNLKRGVKCRLSDIENDLIPQADYIVIQGSLHLFEDPAKIIRKLKSSAKKAVIISESIHHVEEKGFFRLEMAKKLNATVAGTYRKEEYFRFHEQEFRETIKSFSPQYYLTPGGRDLIAVIRKAQ
jgi:glycosyltransferase AglD